MQSEITEILFAVFSDFPVLENEPIRSIETISHGHINHSYKVEIANRFVFAQEINDQIFTEVDRLSAQIRKISEHLDSYYQRNGLPYEALQFYSSFKDQTFSTIEGKHFRISDFKLSLSTFQSPQNAEMVFSAGKAFAHFARGLSSLPLKNAYVPIEGFHDLSLRYHQLRSAMKNSDHDSEVSWLFDLSEDLFKLLSPMLSKLKDQEIPVRWTHNDTKLNNLLFDEGLRARCVVDLDTVMPGSILFDIGDALRTVGSSLAEDDGNVSSLKIHEEAMESFSEGYLSVLGDKLNSTEKAMLPLSGVYMATIMGYRFLTDYLMGNVYYQIEHEEHNLHRATNQLCLAKALADKIRG